MSTAHTSAMFGRLTLLVLSMLLAPAADAETVYKYRRPDGTTLYSDRPVRGLELIETFEYRFTEPVSAERAADKSLAEAEVRIQRHLATLQDAWNEVQAATAALATAEARLLAGVEPQDGESRALAGPAVPAAPAVGGPQPPATPGAGGPTKAAPPAVGGPLGTRHGGGRSVEYIKRMQSLEDEVQTSRARFDAALRRYNELR